MNRYLRHIAILFVFLTGVPGNVSGNELRLDYISYLKASINHFQYIINTRKASVDQVKGAFKELFVAKADDIYNTSPSIFNQFDRIGGGKIEDLEDFIELVNHKTFNTNNQMFNFIKD